MSESIILIGGGGHARVIIDCIRASGREIAGILDDALVIGTTISGVPVLGKVADYTQHQNHDYVIAIGNNAVRREIAKQANVRWATVIHPSAVVSSNARIGSGTVVMPCSVISAGAVTGEHCIINTGAVVEHDSILHNFVHISTRAALGGTVTVGECTHIGIGACVRNNIHICGNCTIGAGAVVVKDIAEPGTYVGIPARRMK